MNGGVKKIQLYISVLKKQIYSIRKNDNDEEGTFESIMRN